MLRIALEGKEPFVDSKGWDARYSEHDLVWSAEPNVFVVETTAGLPAGRALDIAGGEGRNALWLADRGWHVTIVDFSAVAVGRAEQLWAQREQQRGSLKGTIGDVTEGPWGSAEFDLVVLAYLHLPARQQRSALQHAARAVAPGGHVVVVGHHTDNLAHGSGGPQDPALLYTPEDVVADLKGAGLAVMRAETVTRQVRADDGPRSALDALVVAVRPALSS